jgi:3-hydroxyisobutyrate dehydrogenase-like beta-hydroxyacid dehydrogenase
VCGTISVALCQRLTVEHAKRGIDFVGAPVQGNATDARDGRLRIVAAGADKAVARARPLLEAFSQEITVAGNEPCQAFAAKLPCGNR